MSADAPRDPGEIPSGVLFGAAYYHEYRPTPQLDRDLNLMVEAGFTVIRVGESVWSTWEPEEGRFDLDWLEPVLDGAYARGIQVILGTPTYAAPPWMARLHPEIVGDTATNTPMRWGSRQEMDFTHPAFRFYAERVSRAIIRRYLDHPAIIGYQVDNEPGIRLLYNTGVFQRFVDHLRATYGTVERLNEAWGLVYWSHRLSTWADLWVPDGNAQPQYDLAWRRFQAQLVTEYIGWQADIVREEVAETHPERFVTTCISYDQLGVEDERISDRLTIASGNAYYEMQDALTYPSTEPMSPGWIVSGVWGVYQLADLMYSSRQAPFLVTETNAGSIGHGSVNSVAYDGQWRQSAWALVSRGARMVEYWHWHTLPFGTETFWGGVLPHDGRPGRAYAEIARIGAELRAAEEVLTDAEPDADVAFLYDSDSKWALSFGPLSPLPGATGWGDADSYRGLALPFYRGAFDAGLQVNTIRPRQLFGDPGGRPAQDPREFAARRPVLVVVGQFTATDSQLEWLVAYAAAGGHLVVGPRTGYGDEESRARVEVKPAIVSAAAGVSYQESSNLHSPVTVTPGPASASAELRLDEGAAATAWSDYLVPTTADVLVGYDHPHHGSWAAVTTQRHGDGRITVVGTVPNQALATSLLRWATPTRVTQDWVDLPDSVRVTTSRAAGGRRIWFLHHWAWGEADVTCPRDLDDVLAPDTTVLAGHTIRLGPWDVRVLVDHPSDDRSSS
ncbi:beta-galactosidase (plasmid) [Cellulomonas sp. WB94]|uniref:beta-galactosidase n=1 Tax=Cellulomonas sp. WB94 TaxID=2173174 RepID=UPI000D563980|nr:beta-galactosidase [Cellulomonas sp. WB94]PVU81520.1 beta-galactosidase [Cellulomonas sp. WB94]